MKCRFRETYTLRSDIAYYLVHARQCVQNICASTLNMPFRRNWEYTWRHRWPRDAPKTNQRRSRSETNESEKPSRPTSTSRVESSCTERDRYIIYSLVIGGGGRGEESEEEGRRGGALDRRNGII